MDEQSDRCAVGVEDLDGAGIRVVGDDVGTRCEGDPVELCRGPEDAVDEHAVEFEVFAQLLGVDVVELGAQAFGPEGPVPRRDLVGVDALGSQGPVGDLLQCCGFASHVGHRRGDQGVHQRGQVVGSADGLGGEDEFGVVAESQQPGTLGAQGRDASHDLPSVELVAPRAADDRGLVEPTTGVAVGQTGLIGVVGVERQRDEPALDASFGSHAGADGKLVVAQAVEVTGIGEQHGRVVGVGQQVLLEGRRQARQLLIEFHQPCLGLPLEAGPLQLHLLPGAHRELA